MIGYQCLKCGATLAVDYPGYVCPYCRGNLDVQYDYNAIRSTLDPRKPFSGRREDLFKYAAVLPMCMLDSAPPLRVGATPMFAVPRLGALAGLEQLYLKDEGMNPSQSFKDRASAMIAVRARETGAAVVAGASTGNAGSSMACMAAASDLSCVVFVPEQAPPAKIAQLLIYGARVIAVRGTYDQAFDLCARICEEKGWFNRNTGFNPFTREGKKTASYEICEALGWKAPDRVIVPTGDGNIISGIWKGMRELHALGLIERLPRIDCAQAEGSAAVSRAIQRTRESGRVPSGKDWQSVQIEPVQARTLADSISVDEPRDGLAAVRAVIESGGHAESVCDDAILDAIKDVARLAGVFVEPSCACAWACLRKMAEAGKVEKDERIVCLMTGCGLKDIQNARKAAGDPIVIDPDIESARRVLED
jgi:threonine synthase